MKGRDGEGSDATHSPEHDDKLVKAFPYTCRGRPSKLFLGVPSVNLERYKDNCLARLNAIWRRRMSSELLFCSPIYQ